MSLGMTPTYCQTPDLPNLPSPAIDRLKNLEGSIFAWLVARMVSRLVVVTLLSVSLSVGGLEDWRMGDLWGSLGIFWVLGGTLRVLGQYLGGTWAYRNQD